MFTNVLPALEAVTEIVANMHSLWVGARNHAASKWCVVKPPAALALTFW